VKGDKSTKTLVIDRRSGARVPYLRGILTRSLQQSGLGFKEAYKVAELVRRELSDVEQIDRDALRVVVGKAVAKRYGNEALRFYQFYREVESPIVIIDRDGQRSAFVATRLTRALEAASLLDSQANAASGRIQRLLLSSKRYELTELELSRMTYEDVLHHHGEEKARRYLLWLEYWRSGRPLILLTGGVNGVGKSSLSAQLSNLLEIPRIQSTDMLREVMRKMVPKRLLPALHRSSFRAWQSMPDGYSAVAGSEELVIDGFLTQAEQVAVAMDAVLERAFNERVGMILEGIHLHPAYMRSVKDEGDAIVVPLMIAALDSERLQKQLRGRAVDAPSRRSEHYLSHFDMIWQLQSFLLSEADRNRVPIIAEQPSGNLIEQAQELVFAVLGRNFSVDPATLYEGSEQGQTRTGDA